MRVIACTSSRIADAMSREDTEPLYLDIDLPAIFSTIFTATHNAFVFVYRGALSIGGTLPGESRMSILAGTPIADGLAVASSGQSHCRRRQIAALTYRATRAVRDEQQRGDFQVIGDLQEGRLGNAG